MAMQRHQNEYAYRDYLHHPDRFNAEAEEADRRFAEIRP